MMTPTTIRLNLGHHIRNKDDVHLIAIEPIVHINAVGYHIYAGILDTRPYFHKGADYILILNLM